MDLFSWKYLTALFLLIGTLVIISLGGYGRYLALKADAGIFADAEPENTTITGGEKQPLLDQNNLKKNNETGSLAAAEHSGKPPMGNDTNKTFGSTASAEREMRIARTKRESADILEAGGYRHRLTTAGVATSS